MWHPSSETIAIVSRLHDLGELVEVAQNEVKRLDQIITQFLKAIRPSKVELEKLTVKEVLDETLAFLELEIKDRDILVEVQSPDHMS